MSDYTDLERDLEDSRPIPAAALLDRLCQKVEGSVLQVSRSPWHARLGLVVAIAMLAAFAALGGVSAIAKAGRSSAHRVTTVLSAPAHHKEHPTKHPTSHEGDDTTVCERGDHRVHHVTHREARYLKAAHLADDAPCPVP
jgi:hypothetical protein